MVQIKTIMTENPIFVSEHTNINKARMLMSEKGIRHLPVKKVETGELMGMLGQKAVLSNAIKVINQRGFDQLEHVEKSMDVGSILDQDAIVCEADSDVVEVAKALKEKGTGCVAIVENGKLVGVVTSSDFVKLAIDILS